MLKEILAKFGNEKFNSLTKYPSILPLHEFGQKKCFIEEHTTSILGEKMKAFEKIDGTNIRFILWKDDGFIGTRNELFLKSGNKLRCFNPIFMGLPQPEKLTVIYGELYGGKITVNSKNYTSSDKLGIRVFDVIEFEEPEKILSMDINLISKWREKQTATGMIYGQNFLPLNEAMKKFPMLKFVPEIDVNFTDYSIESVYEKLLQNRNTKVALDDTGLMRSEGLILRNEDRSKIVKLRFEDYERTSKFL